MAVWITFFGAMTALGRTDGRHTGDSLPFWQQACEEGRPTGCKRLLQLEAMYCGDSSAWACNELGTQYATGTVAEADSDRADAYFSRACELRFQAAVPEPPLAGALSAGSTQTAGPPSPAARRRQEPHGDAGAAALCPRM